MQKLRRASVGGLLLCITCFVIAIFLDINSSIPKALDLVYVRVGNVEQIPPSSGLLLRFLNTTSRVVMHLNWENVSKTDVSLEASLGSSSINFLDPVNTRTPKSRPVVLPVRKGQEQIAGKNVPLSRFLKVASRGKLPLSLTNLLNKSLSLQASNFRQAGSAINTLALLNGHLGQVGPCIQQWNPHATGQTVFGVAIPPNPIEENQNQKFLCVKQSNNAQKSACREDKDNINSSWTYDPIHELTHQLTFYPYELSSRFKFSGIGLTEGKTGTLIWFMAKCMMTTCPDLWRLKARLVGPAIVHVVCHRIEQCKWNCSYMVMDGGVYRLEILMHKSKASKKGYECHNEARQSNRTSHMCIFDRRWARHPALATEYVYNQTISIGSNKPNLLCSSTPRCSGGNNPGRWLKIQSVFHLQCLNGSAFSGSNLDYVLDAVGLNRGWIWAPYDCHYHFYSVKEFVRCSEQYASIAFDNRGDSVNREMVDNAIELLQTHEVVNGKKVKPGTSHSFGSVLWAPPASITQGSVLLLGESIVKSGKFQNADNAEAISFRLQSSLSDCKRRNLTCFYYFPPALHQWDYRLYDIFASRLETEIKARGLWKHIIDGRASTLTRWDGTHDGIHYLWHVGSEGDMLDEMQGIQFTYEFSYRGTWERKSHRDGAVSFIKFLRLLQDGCSIWNGGVSRMNGMIFANAMCNFV